MPFLKRHDDERSIGIIKLHWGNITDIDDLGGDYIDKVYYIIYADKIDGRQGTYLTK